ncbi:MAG TPA: hypothetical protein VFM96_02925 [Gaiellaceae bacterium]|nr:hypothetical protein [Gaiellaceae bacterium]
MPLHRDVIESLARTTLLVRRDIYPDLDDVVIAEALASTRVRLTASDQVLANANGQTAVVTAAILTAQLGAELQLDFNEVELVAPQPPLRGEGLRESLIEHCNDLITPAVPGVDCEFTIAVGNEAGGHGIAFGADDWGFNLVTGGVPGGITGQLPFGPVLGAVAASAEVFRHQMLMLGENAGVEPSREHPIRFPRPSAYRLDSFDWMPTDLGQADSISAGALVTAALYLLLRVPELAMQLRLIDGDHGALSNLNRYLLLRKELLHIAKTEALSSYQTDAIQIDSVPRRFDEESVDLLVPLAGRVLVGVDEIPSRWRVQRIAPSWVGIAATSHFEAVVSEHTPDSPCAGCLHPRNDEPLAADEIPTVSFVSSMAGFLVAYRLLRAAASTALPSQTLAYPFNLAGERPAWDMPLAATADCPVSCKASQGIRSVTSRPRP